MTNLEWVHALETLPGVVGIVSNSSAVGDYPIIEIYYDAPIDKERIIEKIPLAHQKKTIFKDLSAKDAGTICELVHAEILYESKGASLSKRVIKELLREASDAMQAAENAAARGDSHFVLSSFVETVNCWNGVIFRLNNHTLKKQEGAAKRAARMPVKPAYYLVRLEQAYTYFASHNPALGFDEFYRLHNEIKQIVLGND